MKFRIIDRAGKWVSRDDGIDQLNDWQRSEWQKLRANLLSLFGDELPESKNDAWPVFELPDETASFVKAIDGLARVVFDLAATPPTIELQDDYD